MIDDHKVGDVADGDGASVPNAERTGRGGGGEAECVANRASHMEKDVAAGKIKSHRRARDLSRVVKVDVGGFFKALGHRSVVHKLVGDEDDAVISLDTADKPLHIGNDVRTDTVADQLCVDLLIMVDSLVHADTATLGIMLNGARGVGVVGGNLQTIRNKALHLLRRCGAVCDGEQAGGDLTLDITHEILDPFPLGAIHQTRVYFFDFSMRGA